MFRIIATTRNLRFQLFISMNFCITYISIDLLKCLDLVMIYWPPISFQIYQYIPRTHVWSIPQITTWIVQVLSHIVLNHVPHGTAPWSTFSFISIKNHFKSRRLYCKVQVTCHSCQSLKWQSHVSELGLWKTFQPSRYECWVAGYHVIYSTFHNEPPGTFWDRPFKIESQIPPSTWIIMCTNFEIF